MMTRGEKRMIMKVIKLSEKCRDDDERSKYRQSANGKSLILRERGKRQGCSACI